MECQMKCSYVTDPTMLERVKKPFCIKFDWPGGKPFGYTMRREDVAHCLMHVDEMRLNASPETLQADIRRMLSVRRPDHGMIIQALFYLCTHDRVYEAVGGVPTVDFALVQPAHQWSIRFGRQEPGPTSVNMIKSVTMSDGTKHHVS